VRLEGHRPQAGFAGAQQLEPHLDQSDLDVWITRFVCTECGFIEEWIENPNDLKRFKAQD
jgi:hypothetical protein